MKLLNKALFSVLLGSVMTMSAQAAVSYAGQPYAGVKIGQYSPDESGVDDNFSYGIYGGYKFTNQFGIEAEYLATNDGDIDDVDPTDFLDIPPGVTVDVNTEYSASVLGLYGTYDYVFPNTALYAKGRLGVAKNKIDIDTSVKVSDGVTTGTASESNSISDTGVAGGIGLGYNLSPMASVEAMYNFYPEVEDVDFDGITVGAHFKF